MLHACVQKCSYVYSKGEASAEMFIHIAIQNFTMWLSYTELRITAGQQTIFNRVVCPTTFSEICNDIWLHVKFTVIMSRQLSWFIMSTAYWCNTNQMYLLPSLIVSYITMFSLIWTVPVSYIPTGLPVWTSVLLIIFIQFVCPSLCKIEF